MPIGCGPHRLSSVLSCRKFEYFLVGQRPQTQAHCGRSNVTREGESNTATQFNQRTWQENSKYVSPQPQWPIPSLAFSAYYRVNIQLSTYTIMISPGLVQS